MFIKILYSPVVVPFGKLRVNVPPEFLLPMINVPLTIDEASILTVVELKAALLKLIEPVPFAVRSKLISVASPVVVIEGAFDPAAFAIVISFCALVVAVSLIISAPFASLIKVPILGEFIVGVVNVLFVKVSVDVLATSVSAPDGIVTVPPFVMDAIVGVVRVLFVKVSVVSLKTIVPVALGIVTILSAVGSVTTNLVSKSFAVAP